MDQAGQKLWKMLSKAVKIVQRLKDDLDGCGSGADSRIRERAYMRPVIQAINLLQGHIPTFEPGLSLQSSDAALRATPFYRH
jgi:hypothetical protein